MKPSVYLETSIISYLASRPSRDVIVAGMQAETANWWAQSRPNFELVVAEPVMREAALGDPDAARRRMEFIQQIEGLRHIALSDEIRVFTGVLIKLARLPPKAALDAAHIAFAAVGGADYLLTWNCKHIASAVFRPRIESACRSHGLRPPVICTPPELT